MLNKKLSFIFFLFLASFLLVFSQNTLPDDDNKISNENEIIDEATKTENSNDASEIKIIPTL